jgi:hypothetical protein
MKTRLFTLLAAWMLTAASHAQTQADLERQVQAEQWADAAKTVDALLAATPDDATLKTYKAEIGKHLNTSNTRIPDDQIKKLAALVQADKLDEARKVAFTFTLLYPDDARSKEWQARLDAMSGKASPAAAPSAPAPADDDAIKKQVDRELRVIKLAYADAQKLKNEKGEATEPYYEALDKILARPDPFTNTAAVEIPYYATRAQLALEAGDPWVGITTATKLTSLGADKLNNDAYADLFAKLDSRGWLGIDAATFFKKLAGTYVLKSVKFDDAPNFPTRMLDFGGTLVIETNQLNYTPFRTTVFFGYKDLSRDYNEMYYKSTGDFSKPRFQDGVIKFQIPMSFRIVGPNSFGNWNNYNRENSKITFTKDGIKLDSGGFILNLVKQP